MWKLVRVRYEEEEYVLRAGLKCLTGRGRHCHIICKSIYASRNHCEFTMNGPFLYVRDLNSSNGTFINNMRVIPGRPIGLESGDKIGVGVCEVINEEYYVFTCIKLPEIITISDEEEDVKPILLQVPVASSSNDLSFVAPISNVSCNSLPSSPQKRPKDTNIVATLPKHTRIEPDSTDVGAVAIVNAEPQLNLVPDETGDSEKKSESVADDEVKDLDKEMNIHSVPKVNTESPVRISSEDDNLEDNLLRLFLPNAISDSVNNVSVANQSSTCDKKYTSSPNVFSGTNLVKRSGPALSNLNGKSSDIKNTTKKSEKSRVESEKSENAQIPDSTSSVTFVHSPDRSAKCGKNNSLKNKSSHRRSSSEKTHSGCRRSSEKTHSEHRSSEKTHSKKHASPEHTDHSKKLQTHDNKQKENMRPEIRNEEESRENQPECQKSCEAKQSKRSLGESHGKSSSKTKSVNSPVAHSSKDDPNKFTKTPEKKNVEKLDKCSNSSNKAHKSNFGSHSSDRKKKSHNEPVKEDGCTVSRDAPKETEVSEVSQKPVSGIADSPASSSSGNKVLGTISGLISNDKKVKDEKSDVSSNDLSLKDLTSKTLQPFVKLEKLKQTFSGESENTSEDYSNASYSYTTNDKDDIVFASDNDEFPCSQIFDENIVIKSEPQEFNHNLAIANEPVEVTDIIYISDVDSDSDSESENVWFYKLSQSQCIEESDAKEDEKPDTAASKNDDCSQIIPGSKKKTSRLIYDDSEGSDMDVAVRDNDCEAKQLSTEEDSDEKDLPVVKDILHWDILQNKKSIDMHLDTTVTLFHDESDKEMQEDKSETVNGDKTKPEDSTSKTDLIPDNQTLKVKDRMEKQAKLIPALPMPQRKACRRGISGTTANQMYEENKSKASCHTLKSPSKKSAKKREELHVQESIIDTAEDVKKWRKAKLQELSSKKNERTASADGSRAKATARVKVTKVNRGAFLTEDAPTTTSTSCSESPKKRVSLTDKWSDTISKTTSVSSTGHGKEKLVKNSSNKRKHDEIKNGVKFEENSTSDLKSASKIPKIPKLTFNSISSTTQTQKSILPSPSPLKRTSRSVSALSTASTSSVLSEPSGKTETPTIRKRRVWFPDKQEDLVQVRMIEPEGKSEKMPAPRMKDNHPELSRVSTKQVAAKMMPFLRDDLTRRILNWKPSWFEEEKTCKEPVPVFNGYRLCPMLGSFDSFQTYVSNLTPLMLLEMWAKVSKEYDKNQENRQTIKVGIDYGEITGPPKQEYFVIKCHALLNSRNEFLLPQLQKGFLVVVELSVDYVAGKKPAFVHVFGIIYSSSKENLHPKSVMLQELLEYTPNATKKVNLTIRCKSRKYRINTMHVTRLRVVSYIGGDLRLFDALYNLESSPLHDHILNLNPENLFPVLKPRNDLVSKDPLNKAQTDTVLTVAEHCLNRGPSLNLIHGPPGTGKSHVIVNLILQVLSGLEKEHKPNQIQRRHKILLCAPSNAAIDELVLRLLERRQKLPKESRFRMVRTGRQESMHSKVTHISLPELAKREAQRTGKNDLIHVQVEYNSLRAKQNKLELSRESLLKRSDKSAVLIDVKIAEIKKKLAQLKNILEGKEVKEKEIMKQKLILEGADIIATTLGSSYTNQMKEIFRDRCEASDPVFSCCIVDEATQCCEPETLLPLLLGVRNLVLVGDPEQLQATVLSQQAKNLGHGKSLFSRLYSTYTDMQLGAIHFLNVQYRMHPEIAQLPNQVFYSNRLLSAPGLEASRISPLKPYTVLSLDFRQSSDRSLQNIGEADVIVLLTSAIVEMTERRNLSIGIITPYQLQKAHIKRKLSELKLTNIDVDTIDGFQGQERDIILMSCVRTDGVGFMSDVQRINVALTRAKYSLILCGNFTSLKKIQMWGVLLKDARTRGVLLHIPESVARNKIHLKNLIRRCV